MIVREERSSNVLVQTRGNIVLRVEREPARFVSRLQLGKLRNGLASGAFVLGLIGITVALQAPNNDPIQSELRLTSRIQNMEHLLNGIAQASTAHAERAEILQQTASQIDRQLGRLPSSIDASVSHSISSLAGAISELQLKPTFPMVYSDVPSGFDADAKAVAPPVSTVKPAPAPPKAPVARRRLTSSREARQMRRPTEHQSTTAAEPPTDPAEFQ